MPQSKDRKAEYQRERRMKSLANEVPVVTGNEVPTAAEYARDYPGMTPEAIAKEEAHWRKVNDTGVLTDEDRCKLLKWGMKTAQIRLRDVETAKAVLGPTDETIDKVMALVNEKHGAGELMRLGVGDGMTGQAFNYSKDWYVKR